MLPHCGCSVAEGKKGQLFLGPIFLPTLERELLQHLGKALDSFVEGSSFLNEALFGRIRQLLDYVVMGVGVGRKEKNQDETKHKFAEGIFSCIRSSSQSGLRESQHKTKQENKINVELHTYVV